MENDRTPRSLRYDPEAVFLSATNEYVPVDADPGAWSEEMRWMVTVGTKVRQNYGIGEGRTGIIVGYARSRRANRIYNENRLRAVKERRSMTADDHEILIDSEGALIVFDDAPNEVHWFPGQSFGFDCLETS